MKTNHPLKLTLQNPGKQSSVPTKKQFQEWLTSALIANKLTESEVTIRIVNIAESAELNKKYRHKQGPTNVLAFPYFPIPGKDNTTLGDIVICAELVKHEAEVEAKNILAHWAHLTIHGFLHLQGYDHIHANQARIMEQLETKILTSLGFEDPYQTLKE